MDYILYGAGTGASLAVIGWVLREWGPRLRDGQQEDGQIQSASELIDRMNWARFCGSCGMALVFGGTLILIVTGAVALWNPGDSLAARILIGTYILVSILLLLWSALYTRQFGTAGIYRPAPPKPEPQAAVVDKRPSSRINDASGEGEIDGGEPGETETETRDIESVAASRGGLGRFAAFFNRTKSEPATDILEAEMDVDADSDMLPDGVNTEEINDEESSQRLENGSVIHEEVVLVEEHADQIGTISQSEDRSAPVQEYEEDEIVDQEVGDLEPGPEQVVEAVPPGVEPDDRIKSDQQPDSPEDQALQELRRRRLARLSGEDPSSVR